MKYLIKNGTLVSSQECRHEDILIEGEKILCTGPDLEVADAEVIDASGKYIFPGFIDTHTHFDLDAGDFHTADDFYTGTKAAIAGGTTTVLDFTTQDKGQTLKEALDVWHGMADGKSSCDYGFHMSITDWNEKSRAEIPEMTRLGVTSYKLYMAYDNLRVNDGEILEILSEVEKEHGIIGVHCENGDLITALVSRLKADGENRISMHPASRPPEVEAEAIHRLLSIAKLAGAPVNVVHLSTAAGLEEVRRARAAGQTVFAETCPQYLLLDDSEYERPGFDGAAYVLSPPLRKRSDIEALWEAVCNGEIDMIGTDHCSFNMKGQKERGLSDFTLIPNGIPGVEHRPVLFYHFGVASGRTDVNMMCRLLSERPARLFGMYPRKGAILAGSDADLVIWDPDRRWIITAEDQLQNADNTPYEGFSVTGRASQVFLRGQRIVNEGEILAECQGQYIKRKERGI
ncbi:MAG: dihydropyrimidinase [Clostridiales bacterium]|nr:dihydropyrimidinase [Clostridiales bacterium]